MGTISMTALYPNYGLTEPQELTGGYLQEEETTTTRITSDATISEEDTSSTTETTRQDRIDAINETLENVDSLEPEAVATEPDNPEDLQTTTAWDDPADLEVTGDPLPNDSATIQPAPSIGGIELPTWAAPAAVAALGILVAVVAAMTFRS